MIPVVMDAAVVSDYAQRLSQAEAALGRLGRFL
jgi:hypothetical protein